MNKHHKDVLTILTLTFVSFFLFNSFNVLEMIVEFLSEYKSYKAPEITSSIIVFALCMTFYFFRDRSKAKESKKEILKILHDLKRAVNETKVLEGMIPICSCCRKVRDDKGLWNELEAYICACTEAEFTHSYCPICYEVEMIKIDESK